MVDDPQEAPTQPDRVEYYGDRYWNEIPEVLGYMCKKATGDFYLWWMDYFKPKYAAERPFKRGLIIGCGNGWVERDLIDRGIVEGVDAFDADESYLKEARANKGDRDVDYFVADFRTFVPPRTYDLIVNVAALHHAQYLYRIVATLASALEPGGFFVNWEYVGPDRNQYPSSQLRILREVNSSLPERFRTDFPLRPSLKLMVSMDRTEAVHSSEILRAAAQHFRMTEVHPIGGGVAYQILWNNIEPFLDEADKEAQDVLARLLRLDDKMTTDRAVPLLYCFFISEKRTKGPSATAIFDRRIREPIREAVARRSGGFYPKEMGRKFIRLLTGGRVE